MRFASNTIITDIDIEVARSEPITSIQTDIARSNSVAGKRENTNGNVSVAGGIAHGFRGQNAAAFLVGNQQRK